ncbi:pantothenate synthetase [Auricularia subglabra TFB-10046 SS5]|nr:pantothenate synthetase [Auricularia subglabra TFB-10046 SS5]
MSTTISDSPIPVYTDIGAYRAWRATQERVGYVPTMGALHAGHISLVRESLAHNDVTVLTIFVNPAQFAPHEDFASYPRTLQSDLATLAALKTETGGKTVDAVICPQVRDMYPSGITQDVAQQRGTFVSVDGYGQQMEGASRPAFFRGVATVVTKLFNLVQPDHAYFGQKDIQQALLLRRMTRDLLMTRPLAENVHIVPTERDLHDGLALSSRNAYLSLEERSFAPALIAALRAGERASTPLATARALIEERIERAGEQGVHMKLDYVSLNDTDSFDPLTDEQFAATRDAELSDGPGKPVIYSGALWVGKTRLIDNIILGDSSQIIS